MKEEMKNPSKRKVVQRVTAKMVENGEGYERSDINDVEIWADTMPGHVRLFDCVGCPANPPGGTKQNMRAGQMADHINILHVRRGDTINPSVKRWATRQANIAKDLLEQVREARKNQEEVA
jgi:hypothetical protein